MHDRDITIQSAQPMEDFEFGHRDKATWMWWIACGGGLIGMASAVGLTWLTEMSWPINVGGLPIFAWWPNLIIMFELTMLGAILATVITLVVSGDWRAAGGGSDHAEVTSGSILVGVENPPERSPDRVRTGTQRAAGRAHQENLSPASTFQTPSRARTAGDLELIVAAVARRLVGTPAQEDRRVAEAIALHVVVLHLAHALDPQRLPRQILAGAPAALAARHARRRRLLRASAHSRHG